LTYFEVSYTSSLPSISISFEKELKSLRVVKLGLLIDSSENIGKECSFFAAKLVSVIKVFDKRPDFNLASLTILNELLNNVSCFFKKSELDAFCLITKYSSWETELYDDSQNASSINSIADQFLKSYSAYSVKKGK
jgi:hypothetical protein